MGSDWEISTLAELTINHDTKRRPVKGPDRKPGPYPYYGASGIVDYVDGYLFDGDFLLIAEDGENLRTRQTPIAFMASGKFWVNNHAHIVTGNGRANTCFLMYSLLTADVHSFLTGAVMPKLTQGNLNKIPIACPPRKVQDEIVGILGALDDRITLLRETNATLEAIAQALFKSWFVDFDPVHAKQQGIAPEGLDEATAALFPDSFEESELDLVPRGWTVGSIGQIVEVIDCLHAKKPELLPMGQPFLQLNNIRDDGLLDISKLTFISQTDYDKWISRIEVREGDCVITNVGRVGAVAQIPSDCHAAMGRNMTAIRPRKEWPYPTYMIELLQSSWMQVEIKRRTDIGTILDALNVRNIPVLRCVLAGKDVLSAFETVCRPLRAGMEANLQRANLIAEVRDTLLPRLISGQLRLPEAEALLEEV
jgi:type I restriction enzyme S subunit